MLVVLAFRSQHRPPRFAFLFLTPSVNIQCSVPVLPPAHDGLYLRDLFPFVMPNLRRLQFVDLSNSDETVSERRRRIRRHAAKAPHAESRRKRTARFQAQEADKDQSTLLSKLGSPKITRLDFRSSRTDPFDSFVRPLVKAEYDLLQHCTSSTREMWRVTLLTCHSCGSSRSSDALQ